MTSYRYGYVRVSTTEQDPAGQLEAMAAAGVQRIRVFVEYAPGGRDDRPELAALLDRLRPGDTLRGLAAGPAGPFDAAPDHDGDVAGGAGRRVLLTDRGDHHDHCRWPAVVRDRGVAGRV